MKKKKLYVVGNTGFAFSRRRDAQYFVNQLNKVGGKKSKIKTVYR